MQRLRLDRPFVVFDLETTGIDPATDRIVEISVLRISPDGNRESRTRRLNPERPIPAEATRVHGITDADVADEPRFAQVAGSLLEFIGDADLAGFNVLRFDVPLLDREFRDCGLDLRLAQRRVVDALTIFHRMERRDLSAAVEFYLGRTHDGAHSAEADVAATAEIIDAQLGRYDELPRDVGDLAEWCFPRPADAVDQSGKFVWKDGRVVLNFGKHQGKPLEEVARTAPDYLEWIARADFPSDARELARKAIDGDVPQKPETEPQST